ncbi:cytochrome D1 domain-containing protein [Inmirania thermothiophila]|uniref:Protein NirF n=1 Tax=Inmirania thermothiophila TaxID=1750597 RepID=A0A3N1XS90_9GAMM|nr:cytochrome D1 domain-containing protein [Inmirania thermothiophila]ROR29520.1 protein NirF [Inmirania thermothiophila]
MRASAAVALLALLAAGCASVRGTGDLGLVVERADGAVQVVDTTRMARLARIEGLGDLSHASAVFSRDERYAYVFGRDGGLTKVDLLRGRIVRRIRQAGNSIGGAISQDGRVIAVSNYEPGGVRLFDAVTLEPLAEIPAVGADGRRSKVVGLVDAPGRRFVFSLFEAGEIWIADVHDPRRPQVQRIREVGRQPYDALVTPDGRWYIAGLFGEDGLALVDLWHPERGARRILPHYGRGERRLPVYKMPHLEGWAIAGRLAFLPAVGRHELLVVETEGWREVARIPVHGQPVFAMARPDGRQVWVNFAHPDNDTVQVIDTESLRVVRTLRPGPAVLHMEFTPRGEQVWISVRDGGEVQVYDTERLEPVARLEARYPSGIFFTARAHRIGL